MKENQSGEPTNGPSDPPRQFVHLSNGPVAYIDEGVGPAVVAIHGLPGSARDFRWLAPNLSGFTRLIRIDLPGFGETPEITSSDYSPLGRARVVIELVHALSLQRPIVLGHSWGGIVASAAAELEPELFSGLVLIASAGLRPHKMFRRVRFRILSRLLSNPLLAVALRPVVRRLFALGGFRGYPDVALARTLHSVARTSIDDHAKTIERLSLPTLVVWCEDDAVVESDISAELAAACPAGPRLHFRKGGHNPQKSRALEIGEAMAAWMDDSAAKSI